MRSLSRICVRVFGRRTLDDVFGRSRFTPANRRQPTRNEGFEVFEFEEVFKLLGHGRHVFSTLRITCILAGRSERPVARQAWTMSLMRSGTSVRVICSVPRSGSVP